MYVSGVPQSDSDIYVFFQITYNYTLLQETEHSSLCYAVNMCCSSILHKLVYIL